MQKAINIDGSGICRILSIADISAVEDSPNGLSYIECEYVEPPMLASNMDKAYPMYNTATGAMYWQVVSYQELASDMVSANANLMAQVASLQEQLATTQEALDFMLLGGAE